MAFTTIDDPAKYFNTVLYTGSGVARTITTGLESTDMIWNKRIFISTQYLIIKYFLIFWKITFTINI